MGADWYRFTVCAIEPSPLRAIGDFQLMTDSYLELLEQADAFVIPGWRGASAEPAAPELVDSLGTARARWTRTMSTCSGGLSNPRRARSWSSGMKKAAQGAADFNE
jgi:AraC family transcriptional regulator, transcriptional activator FtrA